MTRLRFSLRGLLVATAAIGALLASAVVENKIATAMIALMAATAIPPALTAAAIRGRGYLQTFCLGALIPAGLMCWFVAYEAARHMAPLNASPMGMGASPLTGMPYFTAFCDAFYLRVRYVVFSFGLASIVAGLTAVTTHWLTTGPGDEDLPSHEGG